MVDGSAAGQEWENLRDAAEGAQSAEQGIGCANACTGGISRTAILEDAKLDGGSATTV